HGCRVDGWTSHRGRAERWRAGLGSAPRVRARMAPEAGSRTARSMAAASGAAPTGRRRVGTAGAGTPATLSGPTRSVVAVALFGCLATGCHRAKPAHCCRGASPASSRAAVGGSVGAALIGQGKARFRPDVVAYYEETWLDFRVLWMTLGNPAIHFGYWDEGTRRHGQSLDNMNRVMADIACVSQGDRVLDAGCGVGGAAFWLAQNRGAL